MKKVILALLIFMFLSSIAYSGVVGKSLYDGIWTIYVTSCDGQTIVYSDCIITNQGEWEISFIPNQGRIPTKSGREIVVMKNICTSVILSED